MTKDEFLKQVKEYLHNPETQRLTGVIIQGIKSIQVPPPQGMAMGIDMLSTFISVAKELLGEDIGLELMKLLKVEIKRTEDVVQRAEHPTH